MKAIPKTEAKQNNTKLKNEDDPENEDGLKNEDDHKN